MKRRLPMAARPNIRYPRIVCPCLPRHMLSLPHPSRPVTSQESFSHRTLLPPKTLQVINTSDPYRLLSLHTSFLCLTIHVLHPHSSLLSHPYICLSVRARNLIPTLKLLSFLPDISFSSVQKKITFAYFVSSSFSPSNKESQRISRTCLVHDHGSNVSHD